MTSISPEEEEDSPQKPSAHGCSLGLSSSFARFAPVTAPPALPHQPLALSLFALHSSLETIWNISQICIAAPPPSLFIQNHLLRELLPHHLDKTGTFLGSLPPLSPQTTPHPLTPPPHEMQALQE